MVTKLYYATKPHSSLTLNVECGTLLGGIYVLSLWDVRGRRTGTYRRIQTGNDRVLIQAGAIDTIHQGYSDEHAA